MEDRFKSTLRTPRPSEGRDSLYGRLSLYNQPTRNSFRPSDAGRFSFAGNIQSSAMKKNFGVKSRQTRNVRDKAHMEEQKKILRDFLKDKESQLDPKCINGPSTKEFQALFEFIFFHVDPDYQVVNIKDEFPRIMEHLKYPLSIKPSTMQTISTFSSWPYLLDALGWLASFVSKVENLDVMALMNSDEKESNRRFHAYDYFTRCFKKHKAEKGGATDDFKAEYELFRQGLLEGEDNIESEDIGKEKMILEEELRDLKKENYVEQLKELEDEEHRFQRDIKQIMEYLNQANIYFDDRESYHQQLQAKLDENADQLQKVEQQNGKKREQIDRQSVSAQQLREANIQLANVRERYKLARADFQQWKEEPTKLQGLIYKLLTSLREGITVIGGDISNIAADFYTRDEHQRLGFDQLGMDRAMDLAGVHERLALFKEMCILVSEKMDQTMKEHCLKTQRNKELAIECDRLLETTEIATKKFLQDADIAIKNQQNINDGYRYELNQYEMKTSVLHQKLQLAQEKMKKVQVDVQELQKQIGDLEVSIARKTKENEEKFEHLFDVSIDNSEKLIQKHEALKKIQKEQDDVIDALTEQHTDMIHRLNAMETEENL